MKKKRYVICFGCGKRVRRHVRGHPNVGVCWKRSCHKAWRRDKRETRAAR